MYRILYQIFKIISSIFKKKHGENINNPSIRIYVNNIENKITFKIKTEYSLEFLTSETMKLLEIKDKNCENEPHLEITDVVLVH